MLRFFSSLCAAMLTCGSLAAALPPLYQGVAELNALIHDSRMKEIPDGDAIESITKTKDGWEVTTNHSLLQVDIENVPQQRPGPTHFRLKFHPVQPR